MQSLDDKKTSKEDFSRLMFGMAKAIPKFAPDFGDKITISIWYQKLCKYPYEVLRAAVYMAIETQTEFPALAIFLRLISNGTAASDYDLGVEIINRIERAFTYGTKESREKFMGEIGTKVVAALGGWEKIGDLTTSDMPSWRKYAREVAEITCRKAREGTLELPPKMPLSPAQLIGKTFIKNQLDSIKTIDEKPKD